MTMSSKKVVKNASEMPAVRGYLLHLTHYDPGWYQRKARERSFDLDLALEIVDELAERRFNALLVGVSDGAQYASHPELAKHYSVPMSQLERLCSHARSRGLEVIPKLNFARSAINHHDEWLRAPGEEWHTHFDDDTYWKTAFEVIDELISVCKPERFFHCGMDEDHERSYSQYVAAVETLQTGIKQRGLRPVFWSDSSLDYASGDIYREKSLLAERRIAPDGIRLLWNYWAVPAAVMRKITRQGHELWGAPGWNSAEQVIAFRGALVAAGGTGLVMTRWAACRRSNRRELLEPIRRLGPLYTGNN